MFYCELTMALSWKSTWFFTSSPITFDPQQHFPFCFFFLLTNHTCWPTSLLALAASAAKVNGIASDFNFNKTVLCKNATAAWISFTDSKVILAYTWATYLCFSWLNIYLVSRPKLSPRTAWQTDCASTSGPILVQTRIDTHSPDAKVYKPD